MNIFEFSARKDHLIEIDKDVQRLAADVGGSRWNGFQIAPGSAIVIRSPLSYRVLRAMPPFVGWYANSEEGTGRLEIKLKRPDATVAQNTISCGSGLTPVRIPWGEHNASDPARLSILVRVPQDSRSVRLLVTERLDRTVLIERCKGKGIEIGPGMTPQIFQSPEVDVTYIDEYGREDWIRVYQYKIHKYQDAIDRAPWHLYHVGKASHLPVDDGELDFIFGSHLFEHCLNPIYHLTHWLSKLKSGGAIHCILPHLDGSIDTQFTPSTMERIRQEHAGGMLEAGLSHYMHYFGSTGEQRFKEGRTLHVHFYNPETVATMLESLKGELPISHYEIFQGTNGKEMFFTIVKA